MELRRIKGRMAWETGPDGMDRPLRIPKGTPTHFKASATPIRYESLSEAGWYHACTASQIRSAEPEISDADGLGSEELEGPGGFAVELAEFNIQSEADRISVLP